MLILYVKSEKKIIYLTISETREMSSVSHTENANVTDRKQLPFRDNI